MASPVSVLKVPVPERTAELPTSMPRASSATQRRCTSDHQGRTHVKRLSVVLGLLLLSACSTVNYELNPDGSQPVLYPAKEVLKWPVVDGARQSPSNNARIYIDPTARFDNDVRLGDGVRIGAGAFIDEDVMLFQNVTVGEETEIGGD